MNHRGRRYWDLLFQMAFMQFKLKDQSTFFGFIWSFLNPIIMLLIIYLVFSHRIGQDVNHYSIYVLIGIVHYTNFANTTSRSMSILHNMSKLTTDTTIPKEVLVIGSVLSSIIEFVLSLVIAVIIAYISGIHIGLSVINLPIVILLQLTLVLWISLILSCIYIFVRDTGHIYQVFLRVLFFATPIFYTLDFLGNGIAKSIVSLNPLTHIIDYSRLLIIEGHFFSMGGFSSLLMINIIMILFSFILFKKLEPSLAEHV